MYRHKSNALSGMESNKIELNTPFQYEKKEKESSKQNRLQLLAN